MMPRLIIDPGALRQQKNREAQARWRERHIEKRRRAQRIVNILVRKTLADEHIQQIAWLLNEFLNRDGVRTLRRALKPTTDKEMAALHREAHKHECKVWLREHPGMTAKDYRRLLNTDVLEWRRTKMVADFASEQQDWEREHPGEEYPEHECGLSDREYTDLGRWRRERWRRQRRRKASGPSVTAVDS